MLNPKPIEKVTTFYIFLVLGCNEACSSSSCKSSGSVRSIRFYVTCYSPTTPVVTKSTTNVLSPPAKKPAQPNVPNPPPPPPQKQATASQNWGQVRFPHTSFSPTGYWIFSWTHFSKESSARG